MFPHNLPETASAFLIKPTKREKRMKAIALLILAAICLLAPQANRAQQEPARPRTPTMTTEDAIGSGGRAMPEVNIAKTAASGSPIRNPRAFIESMFSKMSAIESVRTRMQTSLPTGVRGVTIETVKPDRGHLVGPDGELIFIGRKFYARMGDVQWQVTARPTNEKTAASGFDFGTFVKPLLSKTGVQNTGLILGDETIEGTDTIAYEFTITEGGENGVMQACVGKEDGFLRRLFFAGGAMSLKIWFSSINEPLSIEAPI